MAQERAAAVGPAQVDAALPYAHLPYGLRVAGAWAWRLLAIGVVSFYVLDLIGVLRIVVIPLVVALLLTALLAPAVRALREVRAPRSFAAGIVLVGGLSTVVATLTAVVTQFVRNVPALSRNAAAGVDEIREWLRSGPLHLSDRQLDQAIDTGQEWLDKNTASLTSGAVSTAATLFEMLTGAVLVLFATFFFLRDGERIWAFLVRLFPRAARSRVRTAGDASWVSLGAYVRATVLVAFIDAIGIGLALSLLKVPLAFPLAALVFLGAFVPIVGAALSGTVAVLVALVDADGGPVKALLVLGAVILVQQLEGHVLQPLIMGKAVALHPLAVIIAIAAGVVLAGIVGALIAVPLVAVLNTGVRQLVQRHPAAPPDAVVVKAPAN
ncbi:AI-2E family transporter [Pilimelia terevasa]|uniref:AI-2E family transporter n=1 Tax=Pilimelia terevasa TaxID=53372 RepID=UPI001E483ED0|nr:AI-2E family transporter [Pilimelia terevasa]